MKKNKNIFMASVLLLSLGLASCTDSFLDVTSKTESSTGTFYKTEKDAYRALIGCYDGWRQTSSAMMVGFYMASEVMSAECFGATGNADGRGYQAIDRFDISQSPADLNLYEGDWKNYYAGVYRCNELIAHEEQIVWNESDSKRGIYMGECRTLRALLYLDMVRLWGNIPLFLEPVNENRAPSPAKEVFSAIFTDLKYAIENIPGDAYPKADYTKNDGHITKYAAEALLARAYLFYTGYYGEEPVEVTRAEALAAVEDVIASGEYGLVPQFKNLWPASSAKVAEKGDYETLKGTYAGDGNKETILALKFTATQDYNGNNDSNRWQVMLGMRQLNAAPYCKGWGALTVNPDFVEAFPTGDLRRSASIIDLVGEGITGSADFTTSFNDWREYTGYAVPNAQTYFDQVRKRAYQVDDNGTVSANYQAKSVSQQAIMEERRLEFAFESINYWDLLRQGIDVAAEKLALNGVKVKSGGADDAITIRVDRVKATKGLSQIPYNQINLSQSVLVQNPGW